MTLEADQAVQEGRFAGACQDQHAGRPALAKAETSVVSLSRLQAGAQGLGPGPPAPWGRGLQGLGAAWQASFFIVLKKSLGGRQAKGWETAETAAEGEKKRIFTLSVTETIQHAPQGRRITPFKESRP